LVNESNIRTYAPDTPDEFFRLPYAAAKSDFVRSSVLFHQGGLYMDADFLVMRSLDGIFEKLDQGWDIVVYTDGGGVSGACDRSSQFSSNFMAARKGNPFSATWWHNMKHKLTRMCGEGELSVEKVCCHEAWGPTPERRACHIPWGHLEWLKNPDQDADAQGEQKLDPTKQHSSQVLSKLKSKREGAEAEKILAQVAAGNTPAKKLPPETQMYCLRGPDAMTPHLNGEVYWQRWNAAKGRTVTSETSRLYDNRFDCTEGYDGELECVRGNWGNAPRNMPRLFNRTAYHLFFSTRREVLRRKEDVYKAEWLLSELYARSLGKATPKPPKTSTVPPKSSATGWMSLGGLSAEEGNGLWSGGLALKECQARCDKTFQCLSITFAPGWCHLKDKCITAETPFAKQGSSHNGGEHTTYYKSCETPTQPPADLSPWPPPGEGAYKYRIFTYWDYAGGPDAFVALNVESWLRNSPPGTEVVHVNDTNIHRLVPDLPQEYYRLPYAAAKSDFVRSSVLYHQGGLYMDTDYLVGGNLSAVFRKLDEGWDIVSYQDGGGITGDCGRGEGFSGFSSNFMAARKGNPLSETWWTNIKHKLTRICDVGEFAVEKVCCHEAFAPKPETRKCHIPWAHLEWLKLPRYDSDARLPGLGPDAEAQEEGQGGRGGPRGREDPQGGQGRERAGEAASFGDEDLVLPRPRRLHPAYQRRDLLAALGWGGAEDEEGVLQLQLRQPLHVQRGGRGELEVQPRQLGKSR